MKKMIMILMVVAMIFATKETEVYAMSIGAYTEKLTCGDFSNPTNVEVLYFDGGRNAKVVMEGTEDGNFYQMAASMDYEKDILYVTSVTENHEVVAQYEYAE